MEYGRYIFSAAYVNNVKDMYMSAFGVTLLIALS